MQDQHIFHPADEVYERFWLKALTSDLERFNHAMKILRQFGYVLNIDTTSNEQYFIIDIQKSTQKQNPKSPSGI